MIVTVRARLLAAPLVCSSLLLAGCVSSPTYGTGKSQSSQLTSDLTGMFSLKPKATAAADYKPRPDLVKPASLAELPAPQDSINSATNPEWPESPEQKRARLRNEATQNQDNPLYQSSIVNDIPAKPSEFDGMNTSEKQDEQARPLSNTEARSSRDEYNRRLAESKQGSATKRKYLSEPPLDYRVPAETAATDDVGEDEDKKARRIKREATKKGSGGGWRNLIPWL